MGVRLTAHQVRNIVVIEIFGRLTVLDQTLRESIHQFLKTGNRQFILKMSELSYIDSCGLGELLSVYASIRNLGGDLRILTPSARVRELLHITRLDTVFDILEDAAPFANNTAASSAMSV
jgi:anti-sigma B factor antagonist